MVFILHGVKVEGLSDLKPKVIPARSRVYIFTRKVTGAGHSFYISIIGIHTCACLYDT